MNFKKGKRYYFTLPNETIGFGYYETKRKSAASSKKVLGKEGWSQTFPYEIKKGEIIVELMNPSSLIHKSQIPQRYLRTTIHEKRKKLMV